ncbi:MAG: Hsp20/alpha crystallin family protein [Acidimicrobiales bacterium]
MGELKSVRGERRLPDFTLSWPSWRWFDEVVRDLDGRPTLRVEEFHEAGQWVVRVELPGVDPDKDVTVEVVDGDLVITAERRHREETTEHHVRRSEFRYGVLTRSVALSEGVDASSIEAAYTDGILEVRAPMPETHTDDGVTRTIEIRRG